VLYFRIVIIVVHEGFPIVLTTQVVVLAVGVTGQGGLRLCRILVCLSCLACVRAFACMNADNC
jgi:hypothetical protein